MRAPLAAMIVAAASAAASGAFAMPAPPKTVVRETRYYGTVTIEHEAHVARHAPCASCHGPGVITKPVYTPKLAHDRCVGCHAREERGPQKCQDCHVRTSPPSSQLAAASTLGGGEAPPRPAPAPPELDAANVASAMEAFDRPPRRAREPFVRNLEVGLAGGAGLGLSVRFASHQDWFVFSQSVDALRSSGDGRTVALLGTGLTTPLNRDTFLEASVVAGFDAVDLPVVVVFPALGLRTGVEFRQPRPFLQNVTASLTCVADLSRRAFGRDVGGTVVYGSISTGFRVP
jgi:hypothetical protein